MTKLRTLGEIELSHKSSPVKAQHFCNVLQSINHQGNTSLNSCSVKPLRQIGQNPALEKDRVAEAFETMLIAQFLNPLFSGFGKTLFGDGMQGDLYKSLFSDAIAGALASRGTLGLGKYV